MEKLQNLLKFDNIDGEYGVEIEVEGKNLFPIDSPAWRTEDDGSLRGRFPNERSEYVFKKPLSFKDSVKAINTLFKEQRNNGAVFNFSFRTSIHVHMNMLACTLPQIYNVIYTYYLVEDVLIEYCGPTRKANRFCLTANAAEGILDTIKHIFRQGNRGIEEIRRINGEAVRYAALNLHGLRKYGSLEFRAMRGTDDIETIINWLTALHNLKEFAIAHEDVSDIHDKFIKLGAKNFLKEVLGDVYESFSIPDEEHVLNRSFSITLDLAHAVPDMKEKVVEPDNLIKKGDFVQIKGFQENIIQQMQADWAVARIRHNNLVRPDIVIMDDILNEVMPVQE